MDAKTILERRFAELGARVSFSDERFRRVFRQPAGNIALDVTRDERGERFEIHLRPNVDIQLEAIDVQRRDRHLLLLVRENGEKHKFLCGHDERHWFVAAVPEAAANVASVESAKEALKPDGVRELQNRRHVRSDKRNRRKNEVFIRQGEWFFLPRPGMIVSEKLVLSNEILTRGAGSKPHRMEFCFRDGGELVYVCSKRPAGLTSQGYQSLLRGEPKAKNWNWTTLRRNARVFAKGRIRHPDHKTLYLDGWHQVLMNTENQSVAMRHVAFLD